MRDTLLGVPLKYIALVLLTLQTCAASILVRLSRIPGTAQYSPGLPLQFLKGIAGNISYSAQYYSIACFFLAPCL